MPESKLNINLESVGQGLNYVLRETYEVFSDVGAYLSSFFKPKKATYDERLESFFEKLETRAKDKVADKLESLGDGLKSAGKAVHHSDFSSKDSIDTTLTKIGDTLFKSGMAAEAWSLVKEGLSDE